VEDYRPYAPLPPSVWEGATMTQNTKQHGSVLYLGSGLCSDLDHYLTWNPERIYLVEPNPALKDDLTLLCETHPNIEHLSYGVTPSGKQQALNVYNFFDLSSFSEPKKNLFDIYPGASVESTPLVQTVTPTQLLSGLKLSEGLAHTLIIDTPGLEYKLLEAFISSGLLENFMNLIITMSVHDLFQGSQDMEKTSALVEAIGYQQQHFTTDSNNPDQQMRHYAFDHQTHAVQQLKEDNKTLVATLKTTRSDLETQTTDMQNMRDIHNELQAEFKQIGNQLEERSETLELKENELQKAHKAARKQETTAKSLQQERNKLKAALKKQGETLRTEFEQALAAKEQDIHNLQAAIEEQETSAQTELERVQVQLKATQVASNASAAAKEQDVQNLKTAFEEQEAALRLEMEQALAAKEQDIHDLQAAIEEQETSAQTELERVQVQLKATQVASNASAAAKEQDVQNLKTAFEEQEAALRLEMEQAKSAIDTATVAHTEAAQAFEIALKKQENDLRAELTMAMRIQTRLQSNLQELQGRFATLHTEKHTQDMFIVTLAEEISDSVEYLETAPKTKAPKQTKVIQK
jgi:chromosome segregation ATPase